MKRVSSNGYAAEYQYSKKDGVNDNRGNILSKTVDGESAKAYSYNTSLKDRLTSYDGKSLTYDSIGNVLTYGNKSYTWSSGRNLASITEGENSYTYSYNKYGFRTSKTVNGVTTYFNVAEDGTIISQKTGNDVLYFEYDNAGKPLGFVHNGTQYVYITNISDDVIGIADNAGNLIANYAYDEWGKVTVTANEENTTLANLNPLRYRGYYYDSETGYYYLQSRYYDADLCRFINADLPDYAKEQKDDAIGINIFVYCCNDAVNNVDYTGYKWSIKQIWKKIWKELIDKLKYILKKIKDSIFDYFKEQFDINTESISIGTSLMTVIFNTIVSVIISFKVVKATEGIFKNVTKKIINKSPKKFQDFFGKMVECLKDLGIYEKVASVYLYIVTHYAIKKITKGKYSFSTILKNAAKDIAADTAKKMLNIKSKLLDRVSEVVSAFSSIGGLLAFFLDLFDGTFDGKLTIKYKYLKTYVI